MRAATAIVGAIAVSSILIALAFLLSSGGDSGGAQVTRTVTVEAAAPAQPVQLWKEGPRPFSSCASHCAIWVRSAAPAG